MPQVSTVQKMATVLRYLELGGEWKYEGAICITIVWLDNYVTETLPDGSHLGYHGLAQKCIRIRNGVEEPHYMGLGFTFDTIVQMIDEIPDEDYLGMVASVVLKENVIKRRGKL